jgi:heme-degrading monooxygenase HmoA
MFSAAFIFEPGVYDADFHQLNDEIEAFAHSIDGFLGVDRWKSSTDERHSSIYYWKTREALQIFASHPRHIEAKKNYQRWYKGFHIVISEVLRTYGDSNIQHITPNQRKTKTE